jgi:LemA protein|tara:strand:+ start:6865 stop:7437 length:573 start_codon:yes stop_codon:yes gene_type:complete
MGITEFITGAVLIIVFCYAITIYNGLIRLKNNVDKAFANIEVLLKQRHTELPQLVEVCKGYMTHEKELLLAITKARSLVQDAREEHNILRLGQAETEMRESLHQLFVSVEAYPELKANENFLALQERISVLEDLIADRRETFNESVRLNNTRIQQFPDLVIARPFNFIALGYLRFSAVALLPVAIGSIHD